VFFVLLNMIKGIFET